MTREDYFNELRNGSLQLGRIHLRASESMALRRNIFTCINIVSSIMILFLSLSKTAQKILNDYFGSVYTIKSAILNNPSLDYSEVFVGFFAAFSICTAMLQYHLRYEERHIDHKNASTKYFNLNKKITRMVICSKTSDEDIHMITKQYNSTNESSPIVGSRHRHKDDTNYADM
jgi:hypothetical protein